MQQPVYNKDDFFDTISSNSFNNEQNGRTRYSEQIKIDTEVISPFFFFFPPHLKFGDFHQHGCFICCYRLLELLQGIGVVEVAVVLDVVAVAVGVTMEGIMEGDMAMLEGAVAEACLVRVHSRHLVL